MQVKLKVKCKCWGRLIVVTLSRWSLLIDGHISRFDCVGLLGVIISLFSIVNRLYDTAKYYISYLTLSIDSVLMYICHIPNVYGNG